MHSRDITLLIVLLWFNIVHYFNLFQYFLSMCYSPYSSWKFQIFLWTCLLTFFCKQLLWLVNPCIPHLKWRRVPQLYQLSSEKWSIHYTSLSVMFNPLHSILNQELFKKYLCNPHIPKERNGTVHPSYINYHLKSEASIMFRFVWV